MQPSGAAVVNAGGPAGGGRLNSGRSSVSSAKQLYLSKARYIPGQLSLLPSSACCHDYYMIGLTVYCRISQQRSTQYSVLVSCEFQSKFSCSDLTL